jgi:hypothetical protein
VFNPIATLPKVISPTKVSIPPSTDADDGDDSEGSLEVDFVDSDYEVDDDDDLFCDNVDGGVVDDGAAKGIAVRAGSQRNAPTGTDNDSESREWDELDSVDILPPIACHGGYPGQLFGFRLVRNSTVNARDSRFILVRALDCDRVIAFTPVPIVSLYINREDYGAVTILVGSKEGVLI